MAPTVSAHQSRPSSGVLALCGTCTRHSYSKLYHCVILLLCFSLCRHPPHPTSLSAYPLYIRWPNFNEFHEKEC